jgi:ABC-type Mn2+/Zn2+ transport system permease subunit
MTYREIWVRDARDLKACWDRTSGDEIAAGIYFGIGTLVGGLTAIAAFVAVYVLAIDSVGWLLGIALGWIPALIAAAVAAVLLRYLWPAVLFLLLAAIQP